jgi:CRP/FNR family transcriptional regulator, transcriptional activator FtrB
MPMRLEDVPEVRCLPLFRTMAASSFETLLRGAYLQTFPPQVQLIGEGDASDFLHVLTEGAVELFACWNRRETSMAVLVPISSFILAASISDRPYLMSARTIEKSRIALIPSEDVRRAFADDREFATAIVMELAGGFRSAIRQAKDLKLRSSVERLANYLTRIDGQNGNTGAFNLPTEKRLLASLLGMTPENLSRAFASLRSYGVTLNAAHVTIANPDDLCLLAKPTPLIDDPDF